MKDQEIIEVIATKVMGWEREEPVTFMHKDDARFLWRGIDGNATWSDRFNPLESDADCMEAWDMVCERLHGHMHSGVQVSTREMAHEVALYDNSASGLSVAKAIDPDRRRAMCTCMYKAVSDV